MKTLIAYATVNGVTAKCANHLAAQLEDVTLADLAHEKPCLTDFDTVVIGGCIRAGKLHQAAKKFIEENHDGLNQKRTAYFICCGFPEQQAEYFSKNFPSDLLQKALTYDCFGGELEASRLKGMDKLITKMVAKSAGNKAAAARILYDRIDDLARKLLSE